MPPQHSAPVWHEAPSGSHATPPQKPPKQSKKQHSSRLKHADPGGRHAMPPQKPFRQLRSQQSVASEQLDPTGAQSGGGSQRPPLQVSSAQQSPVALHEAPLGWHPDGGLPASSKASS
jgi:hypothetical protein